MVFPTEDEIQERMKVIRAAFHRKWGGRAGDELVQKLFAISPVCSLGGKALVSTSRIFAHLDHRTSIFEYAAMGGLPAEQACELANSEENLQLVCSNCNQRKNCRDLEEQPREFNCDEPPTLEEMEEFQQRHKEWSAKGGLIGGRIGGRMGSREGKARGGRIGGRIGGRNGSREDKARAGRIGGRRSIELHGSPATYEGCLKGGRMGSREDKAHAGRMIAEKRGSEGMAQLGRMGSREDKARAARMRAKKLGCERTAQISRISLCIRWHKNRGIVKESCSGTWCSEQKSKK